MEYNITFENKRQLILWNRELVGQFSDGFWENARPYNHWMPVCTAKTTVGIPSISFTPSRRYNLTSSNLLDYVGQRMIFMVKLSMIYDISEDKIRALENLVDCASGKNEVDLIISRAKPEVFENYWTKTLATAKEIFNIMTDEQLKAEVDSIIADPCYDMKMLKRDLISMKALINAR